MIKFTDNYAVLDVADPFVGTAPCWSPRWKVIVAALPEPALPTVVRLTPAQELEKLRMPVRIIEEKDAAVKATRSVLSQVQEYTDVMNAIKTLPPGKAAVVTLESKVFTDGTVKKPAMAFAAKFRRMFEAQGVPFTAYQSGGMEVTIKRAPVKTTKRK